MVSAHGHELEVSGGVTVVMGLTALLAKLLPEMQIAACIVTICVGTVTLIGVYRKWRKGEW